MSELNLPVPHDVPEIGAVAGDIVTMYRQPGWQADGVYGVVYKDREGRPALHTVARARVRKRDGTLRKRIVVWPVAFNEGDGFRCMAPHRVTRLTKEVL